MDARCTRFTLFFVLLFSLAVTSGNLYPQKKQMQTKEKAAMTKDQIPITTSSQEARQKYIEGIWLIENAMSEKARVSFQDAVNLDPKFALGYYGLASTGGSFTEIKQDIEKAESFMENISEGEKLLISESKAEVDGDMQKAKDDIQKLLSMFPKDKRVQLMAGQFEFFQTRNYDAAITHFQKAINIDKNYDAAYNLLGYAYAFKNDYKRSENAFKKYISLMPNYPNPYDSYAEMLLKSGRYDESIKQYKKAMTVDPSFTMSLIGIGNDYVFKGDFTKARESYQAYFDKAPTTNNKLTALFYQAASYVREGDINGALTTLDKRASIAESEGSVPQLITTHTTQGMILIENGQPEEAMKRFDMASEKLDKSTLPDKLKNNITSGIKIGRLYAMAASGKIDEVKSELEKKDQIIGSSSDPQAEKYYENVMGYISLKQDKYDEAISHFQKADDANPVIWYYTAVAYEKKGDTQKAEKLRNKIMKSNDNSINLSLANNLVKTTVAQTK